MSRASSIHSLKVALGDRSYRVEVGEGLLTDLGVAVAEVLRPGTIHIITNPTIAPLYSDAVAASLRSSGFEPNRIEIGDGESHKTLSTLSAIYDRILTFGAERSTAILALGGGVVGDVSGFAAATVLRGVPYVQVPTTLLAQVDSSVGGKTAINHAVGKNLIGAFYQPRLVVIDVKTLATLPRRELVAGIAEVIKYGAILDHHLFELLERRMEDLLALDPGLTAQVIARCCEIKAEVVAADERESDFRAVLNFGHTLGHAVEAVTSYERYLHGEAVAIGMVGAAKLSHKLGFCDSRTVDRLAALISRAGLPIEVPWDLSATKLAESMTHDKKATGGKVRFVCLRGIGVTHFEKLVPADVVASMVE